MGLEELSQRGGAQGATIECSLREERKQFTITDIGESPTGILLELTEAETGHRWTLTQYDESTYHLETAATKTIEPLSPSDITIK